MGLLAIFQVPKDTELVLRPIGDGVAAYNCASGATHLLDDSGAALLHMLIKEPLTRRSLVEGVLAALPSVREDKAEAYVDMALVQFTDLGLVEQVGGPSIDH